MKGRTLTVMWADPKRNEVVDQEKVCAAATLALSLFRFILQPIMHEMHLGTKPGVRTLRLLKWSV